MRLKRRRRPVEWINTNFSTFDYDGAKYGILPLCTTNYGGPTAVNPYVPVYNVTPFLIGDEPDADASLTEEHKSYTIRRIVGDLHFCWGRSATVGTGGTAGIHPIMCKWGFAVQNVPPDAASLIAGPERIWSTFNSQLADFSEMDWMSMRTEIYGANVGALPGVPANNPGAGLSYADNQWQASTVQEVVGYSFPSSRHHHVDVKVNRTVRRNQRIFFNVALQGLSADDTLYNWHNNQHSMLVYADLRVLINWKKAFNRKG